MQLPSFLAQFSIQLCNEAVHKNGSVRGEGKGMFWLTVPALVATDDAGCEPRHHLLLSLLTLLGNAQICIRSPQAGLHVPQSSIRGQSLSCFGCHKCGVAPLNCNLSVACSPV